MKLLVIILMLSAYSFGCLWVDGTTIDGEWRTHQGERYYMALGVHPHDLERSLNSTPGDSLEHFTEKLPSNGVKDPVTQAVLKVLGGRYDEAVKALLEEEKKEPGRYAIAANLGTAYELLGENEKALKWIKEAIARNADSHFKTEWLHVAILETKIHLKEEPDYLKANHVIDNVNVLRTSDEYTALLYQLRERMLFIKPHGKDPIMADLLFSFAVLNAEDGKFLEYSVEALDFALRYGPADPEEVVRKRKEYQAVIDRVAMFEYMKIAGYIGLFFLLLFVAYKKKRFFISKKAQ